MWEKILKARASSESKVFYRDSLYRVLSNYIVENYESGAVITLPLLEPKLDEIQELCLEVITEEKGLRIVGPFKKWFGSKGKFQISAILNKMIRLGLMEPGGVKSKSTAYILKTKEFGKNPPKRYSRNLEEDIEEVVADNEFAISTKLSDKVKHILMEGRKNSKPVKTKKDAIEYNNKYPGIKTNIPEEKFKEETEDIEEMDSGCGCGCDGKDVSKASSKCTKRTKKTGSKVKGKKWTQCVPTAEKGKFRRANWGQAGVKVTGDSGDTKRKKSFRARHKCETCKLENGKKRYYSNQCLACRDW